MLVQFFMSYQRDDNTYICYNGGGGGTAITHTMKHGHALTTGLICLVL